MNTTIIDVKISEINVGERFRKEMGDLEGLARSIGECSLQPIGITPDHELIFGERRLRACRDILGWQTIPARIVPIKSVLLGQITENTMRKDFSPSELVAIVETLRGYSHGGDRRSDQARKCDVERLTVDEAAQRVGWSKDTFLRADRAVKQGVPELVQAMDREELSISAAGKLASLKPEKQRQVLRGGTDHAIWFVNHILKERNSTSTPEYSTPQWLFDHLDQEFHFTLDVAALPENAKCVRFFSPKEDGLSQSWTNETVWLNPPFSNREIEAWVSKAYEESRRGATVVMLIPSAYKGYRWWKRYCTQGEVRFLHEYVQFPRCGDGKKSACVDVTVVIFGPQFKPWSAGPVISKARIDHLVREMAAFDAA